MQEQTWTELKGHNEPEVQPHKGLSNSDIIFTALIHLEPNRCAQ